MRTTLDKITIEQSAELLFALANAKRLEILNILVGGEFPVNTLSEMVGLSQSALSQHLAKLRAQKLVSTRRDAQTVYYTSKSPAVLSILAELERIFVEQRRAASN